MTRMLRLTTLAVAAGAITLGALTVAVTPTHADPAPLKESRVEDLRLGEYWFGPEIDKDDLRGKVVLLEIWGS